MDVRIAVPKAAIHHGPQGYSDLPSDQKLCMTFSPLASWGNINFCYLQEPGIPRVPPASESYESHA